MATTGRYKAYRSADVQLQETGYYKAFISLLSDFTTLKEPVLSETPVIGERYTIGEAHVWPVGKEPIPIYVKKETIEAPGESTGETGNLRLKYSPKIFVVGDGPVILEMINNWLNEEMILFVTDGCSPTQTIQFGCDCLPVTVEKGSFASGTLGAGGAKGYELTLTSFCKYFYSGTITGRA